MLEIVEFIARLEQGYTEAFLCRVRDQHVYVVKSVQCGREALIKEMVAARIGHELGLPIPPFSGVYVSPAVARQAAARELHDLAEAPGFGSRWIDGLPTLNPADVSAVDDRLRREVLLFDRWLCNDDRTDYNPNLLWNPLTRTLTVIDHNLTFSPDLIDGRSVDAFWSDHIFRGSRPGMLTPAFRAAMAPAMDRAMSALPDWWAALPDEWTADVTGVTLDLITSTLDHYRADEFWTP
jgi:hypothetical protein